MNRTYSRLLFFFFVLCNCYHNIDGASGDVTSPLFSAHACDIPLGGLSQAGLFISCAGLSYATYKAWGYYHRYSQEKLFNDALALLKGATFWGTNQHVQQRDGEYVIQTINRLALEGYRPACIYQAEHPWLFVDAFISEIPPLIDTAEFYNRYAPYSIARYVALNDAEGFYRAGSLALAHIYSKYKQGVSFNVVAPDIRQACIYLDTAASKGYSAAAHEIARIYREGILVAYNEKIAQECIAYYATLSDIQNRTYPLAAIAAWLYKTYYCSLHDCPVPV